MYTRMLLILVLSLLMSCSKPVVSYDLVIENVGLFDGHSERGVVHIAINSDTIAAISSEKLVGDSIIHATGNYIIPGMVNAHVHVSMKDQLKQGYPLGIMYLLNMHTGMEDREVDWKTMTSDALGYSTLYGSGHAATVPGGHPTAFSPDMETVNDSTSINTWLDHRINNQVDYIKIIHTSRGFLGSEAGPSLSYEQIKQLIDQAHNKGYKAVVHATTAQEMLAIAPFKPDGFVHMPDFKDEFPMPDTYYQAVKNSGAFIVTTGGIALKSMDDFPPFVTAWVTEHLLNAEERAAIIKKYIEYEIPLVAGTDAQEGQMNFGDDYFLELDLYKLAGMSNLEVLKAATGNAAEAFDLPIGELQVGSKANFVMLEASPIEHIENLRQVKQVWKLGKTK